jgi:hypothetical protein
MELFKKFCPEMKGSVFSQITVTGFVLVVFHVSMQKPPNQEPDRQQEENKQGTGQLDRPEQELDLHGGNILNNEQNNKASKDQHENHFIVHKILPLSGATLLYA